MRLKRTLFLSVCVVLALIAITTAATAVAVINTVSPASGGRGETVTVTVSGTGFEPGVAVWFNSGDQWINVQNEQVNAQGTQITGPMTIPLTAPLGNYTILLWNPNQPAVFRANAFEVREPTTVINTVAPTSGNRGQTVTVTVTGTGFKAGANVWFNSGDQWINVQNEQVNAQGTQITGPMTIPATAPLGNYSIFVWNPNEAPVYKANVFEVRAETPTAAVINTVSPESGRRGQTISVTVTGTGFKPGAAVLFNRFPQTINVQNEQVNAQGTQITGTITIPVLAPLGLYAVRVQNPNEPVVSRVNAFTVKNPVATITTLDPRIAFRGASRTVTVTGTNFRPNAQVVLIRPGPGGTIIEATNENVVSPTRITCTINVPTNRPSGYYNAQVRNPFGDPYETAVSAYYAF